MRPADFKRSSRAQHGVGERFTSSARRVLLRCPCCWTALNMRISVASSPNFFIWICLSWNRLRRSCQAHVRVFSAPILDINLAGASKQANIRFLWAWDNRRWKFCPRSQSSKKEFARSSCQSLYQNNGARGRHLIYNPNDILLNNYNILRYRNYKTLYQIFIIFVPKTLLIQEMALDKVLQLCKTISIKSRWEKAFTRLP